LAYYSFIPQKPLAGLIFYHGGGAHCGAGYKTIGYRLSTEYQVAVYLIDIRGHGKSGGPRGDATSVIHVYKDITTMILHLRSRLNKHKIFLGGHSSGAGLVLNYSSWNNKESVDGYVFLAPNLGYRSKTERSFLNNNKRSFSTKNLQNIILYDMSNGMFFGHERAVCFNYPKEILESDHLIVPYNTVIMARALTPNDPHKQIALIDKPFGLWIGSKDELFDPPNVVSLVDKEKAIHSNSEVGIISGATHLSILLNGYRYIGEWMNKCVKQSHNKSAGN
jgi:pimeloyl-ACP methyl ester carboxylesterase